MKLFPWIALLAAASNAGAGNPHQRPGHTITACMNWGGPNAALLARGQSTATQLLKQTGVRLNWRPDERACAGVDGIVVTVSYRTAPDHHPGELAYAMPFQGTRIVLFHDRVLATVNPALAPILFGYILAHEIVHILQSSDAHSSEGIMKRRWNSADYSDIERGRLKFTPEDIALMDRGLDLRLARAARPPSPPAAVSSDVPR